MIENLADLSDKELEDLHGDTIRLAQSGTSAQRTEAERLLPFIGREIASRSRTRVREARAAREELDGTSPGQTAGGRTGATAQSSTGIRLPTKP